MKTHLGINGCEDIAPIEKCAKWEEKGYCSKAWCSSRCPKTCDVCEDDDESEESNDDPEDEVCQDHGIWPKQCENILKKGLCSKPWAAAKCPKTCDACEDDDDDNEGEVCKDHSWPKHCENILNKGLCSKPWLAAKCPKTCGTCEDDGMCCAFLIICWLLLCVPT